MVGTLAWVTARAARGQDQDEPRGVAALRRAGVVVTVVDWDDPDVDWSRFDRAVLRSTWDYPARLPEFSAWLDRVAAVTDLVNPPATVRWSLDKRYLADLAAAGVPTTPTDVVPPGMTATFPPGRFVVKPAVGAGSKEAAWYEPHQHPEAAAHVARLHAGGGTALVQPYLPSVPAEGEWPMVYFDGRFSHAARKRVDLPQADVVGGLFAAEAHSAHEASAEQRDVADAALALVGGRFGTPAYARVDLVRDATGGFCVLELELVEPSLFLLEAAPDAVDRFVAALIR